MHNRWFYLVLGSCEKMALSQNMLFLQNSWKILNSSIILWARENHQSLRNHLFWIATRSNISNHLEVWKVLLEKRTNQRLSKVRRNRSKVRDFISKNNQKISTHTPKFQSCLKENSPREEILKFLWGTPKTRSNNLEKVARRGNFALHRKLRPTACCYDWRVSESQQNWTEGVWGNGATNLQRKRISDKIIIWTVKVDKNVLILCRTVPGFPGGISKWAFMTQGAYSFLCFFLLKIGFILASILLRMTLISSSDSVFV